MAFSIPQKTNTIPPNSDYPYGDIRDNDGTNNGTPVDRAVYADFHQFFARLMDKAGVTANGLPDNATNSFQLFEAFLLSRSNFACTSSTSVTMATSLLSFTVPENMSYFVGVPLRITRTSSTTTYMLGQVASYSGTTLEVLVTQLSGSGTYTDWTINLGQDAAATLAEVNTGTNEFKPVTPKTLADTPTVINAVSSEKINYVELPIFVGGLGWDMDASATFGVPHGITNWQTIKILSVVIFNDSETIGYDLSRDSAAGSPAIEVSSFNSTTITLFRRTSSIFDSTDFNDTGIVRGYVTISYR